MDMVDHAMATWRHIISMRHAPRIRTWCVQAAAMASLLRRPFDLFIVVALFFFLLVAITIGKKKLFIIWQASLNYSL